jgi:hypothetical protein
MTIDFTQPVLFDEANNGYMVTMIGLPAATNGGPNYEVLEGWPNWADIQAWLAAGNEAQDYAPPAQVAVIQTPAQAAAAKAAQLQADQWAAIQAGLLALANGNGTDALSIALQGMIEGVS